MVLCDLYLKRFDSTKGLLFDTSSITVWYKLCRYDQSVLELELFSPPMNWKTEQETLNQMHPSLRMEFDMLHWMCIPPRTHATNPHTQDGILRRQ